MLATCGTTAAQVSFSENHVFGDYGSNLFAAPCDLDGDGWTDVLVTDRDDDRVLWLRNDGATSFSVNPIQDSDGYLTYPYPIDLDQDGDLDILGSTWAYGEACWWDNDGDETFTMRLIGSMPGGHRTIAVDIDEDGDLDVAACGLDGGCGNRWFENDGSQGFTTHVLSNTRCSHCVDYGDFDGDGDIDLVTTDRAVGLVLWWNDGSENFTHSTVPFAYAHWVLVDDLDQDDDPDLIAVGYNPSEVAWWENDGFGSFTKRSISTTFGGPLVVDAGDLDEDGDRDVTVAGEVEGEVSWWENDGAMGFTEHPLTGAAWHNAESVQIADVDGDSDADLLCAGSGAPCVRWFESDIVDMGFSVEPPSGIAPVEIVLTDSSTSRYAITGRTWDCDNDGTVDATGHSASWTCASPGTHSVLLEISMGERTGRALSTDVVEAFNTGSALWFDGESGVVVCVDSLAAPVSGPLTIEAWIAPFGWGGFPIGAFGFGQVLDAGNLSLLLTGTHPARSNESVYLELRHPGGVVSGACGPVGAVTLDEWQHVAATYDGAGTVRMWIDGAEQTVAYTSAPSGELDSGSTVTLGNIAGTLNRTFEGAVDEVRLWNLARSRDDLLAAKDCVLAGDEPGLVGYWALDEGSGGSASDGSEGHARGTITNAEWVQGVVLHPTGVDGGDDDRWGDKRPRLATAPNPFGRATSISLTLARPSRVTVTVNDVSGRLVREITSRWLDAGAHTFRWDGMTDDGRPAAAGVYFCRAESDHGSATGKMVLLR